jgi:hypothetical protein
VVVVRRQEADQVGHHTIVNHLIITSYVYGDGDGDDVDDNDDGEGDGDGAPHHCQSPTIVCEQS